MYGGDGIDEIDESSRNPLDCLDEESSVDDDEFLPGERPQQLGGSVPEEQLNDEEQRGASEEKEPSEEAKNEGEEEDDESPLEPTPLGNAIDSLMMHWCQLLTNVSVKAPVPPPSTLDHVKEVAEVCSKHFRDASIDVSNEFMRLGIQWELEQAQDQFVLEDYNLDEAIDRQERLLESTKDFLANRVNAYISEFPDAGKHFTT